MQIDTTESASNTSANHNITLEIVDGLNMILLVTVQDSYEMVHRYFVDNVRTSIR